ncbi:expressed unknown protein [Seminavis robusta]|uniref:Uncharacterized protein n=1 Tax=Seminavis robusta TaxID=568900 RepID=A0A9N8F0C9_9STRA|nr:expressed unknown protein [Seminavis robusta]|eukprot:Sro2793_g337231.1  (114) ;mRNA; f:1686-2027
MLLLDVQQPIILASHSPTLLCSCVLYHPWKTKLFRCCMQSKERPLRLPVWFVPATIDSLREIINMIGSEPIITNMQTCKEIKQASNQPTYLTLLNHLTVFIKPATTTIMTLSF